MSITERSVKDEAKEAARKILDGYAIYDGMSLSRNGLELVVALGWIEGYGVGYEKATANANEALDALDEKVRAFKESVDATHQK